MKLVLQKQSLVICSLLFFTLAVNSQRWDGQTWLSASYQQEIVKDVEISVEQNLRFRNYLLSYNAALTDFSVNYKPKKFIRIGGGYRISIGSRELEHRLYAQVTPRIKTKDFNVTFRVRYQVETRNRESFFSHGLREKVEFKYTDFKDWRPYVYGELFYLSQYNFKNFNRYRVGLGTEIDIRKGHDLDVSLFYQQEFNQENPWRTITLSLGYLFNP